MTDSSDESSGGSSPKRRKANPAGKWTVNTVRRTSNKIRKFQAEWKVTRPWLQHEPEKGMWCSIYFRHRTNRNVKGTSSRPNALAAASIVYTYRNVKDHSENKYHLAAMGLDAQANSVVMDSIIHLPASVIPQAKVLFRTVLHMGRNQVAHRQLRFLLELQRRNGVTCNLALL